MRGTLRWARADLRARPSQALLTLGVVAGVVAALVLSTMLLQGAVNPWQQLFARTHGADVLIYFQNGTNTSELSSLPGVRQVGRPYEAASATLEQGPVQSPVELRGMTPVPPAMSTPLIVAGTWLRSSEQDGAVIEASFAAAVHVGVGDKIVVDGIDGTSVPMRVIGIADTADQGFYPQWTPGLIWVQHGLLTAVEPHQSETQEVVGLRLDDASTVATGQVVQTIWNLYNGPTENSAVLRYSTWQQVQNSMASNDRLLGLLLALFGVIALVAAPCAIANVTAGSVLMQRQDIGMLKALGFTPGQVVGMLLAEQTALGAAGAGFGLVAARIMTSSAFVRPPDGTPVGLAPLSGSWVALIGGGAVLTVAIATIIPAWRAGQVSPVAAVQPTPPRGHLSLIARLGLLVRLPPALVLGARDSLTRRLPSALTVVGLAIPMAMITIALICWSTIDGFTRDPGRIGLAAAVTVTPGGGLDTARTLNLISHDHQVLAYYPGAEFDTLLPGDNGTFIARAVGYSSRPYPFQTVQGRMFDAPNEAVAGQGFLTLMHIGVGAWISPTIDGVPVILHIVGRTIEPDNNGDVLDFGLDALSDAGGGGPQLFYALVLKPGVSPAAARATLLAASRDELDVQLVANPADGLEVVKVVIVVAVAVLAVIGLANLLTAAAVGQRDHLHEVGVLKALGLTPRQVTATLVVNTTILTAIGVASGTVAGLVIAPRLINMQGQTSGIGSGIAASLPAATVVEILAIALAIATTAALFLARRTTRMSDSAHLRSPNRPSPPRRHALDNVNSLRTR
ncbi:MAG TPA: FtsX-like permease family protein [Streptosporangiaceae bacterium]|nr:FtsX-like permease family protein [Streptosporangiaceae bacterium]